MTPKPLEDLRQHYQSERDRALADRAAIAARWKQASPAERSAVNRRLAKRDWMPPGYFLDAIRDKELLALRAEVGPLRHDAESGTLEDLEAAEAQTSALA
jgi:hypothetical protein